MNKFMMIVAMPLMMLTGCAQQSALHKQLDASNARVHELTEKITEMMDEQTVSDKFVHSLSASYDEMVAKTDEEKTKLVEAYDNLVKKYIKKK